MSERQVSRHVRRSHTEVSSVPAATVARYVPLKTHISLPDEDDVLLDPRSGVIIGPSRTEV